MYVQITIIFSRHITISMLFNFILIFILFYRQLLNKKLYGELNNLEKIIEDKNQEISHLSKQLDTFYENNVNLNDDKLSLEKKVLSVKLPITYII